MTGWLSSLDWRHSVQGLAHSEEAASYFDEDMEEVRWITFLMQHMVNTVFQCYSFMKFYLLDVMILIRKATLSRAQNVYWCLYFRADRIILEWCCMLKTVTFNIVNSICWRHTVKWLYYFMSHYGISHVKMYYKYVCLSRGGVADGIFWCMWCNKVSGVYCI